MEAVITRSDNPKKKYKVVITDGKRKKHSEVPRKCLIKKWRKKGALQLMVPLSFQIQMHLHMTSCI